MHELVRVFCLADKFNENGNLDHLANVLFNITQTSEGRRLVMARTNEGCVIQVGETLLLVNMTPLGVFKRNRKA